MQPSERLFNIALGFSILSWALLGFLFTVDERPLLVRTSVSLLHVVVGGLVLFRAKIQQHGSVVACLIGIPALVIGGWSLHQASDHWNVGLQIAFVFGCLLTITSFLFLGRSFAILPALRTITKQGPFRWIRHPAYLGELIMIGSCCWSLESLIRWIPLALAIPAVMLRILAEEKTLSKSEDYRAYRQHVRWRLLPFVW